MRKLTMALATAAIVMTGSAANAAVTLAPGTTVSVNGAAQLTSASTPSQATAIDFLTHGVAGPAAGTVGGYIGTGSFASEFCDTACGLIYDIPTLTVGSSVSPLFQLSDGIIFSLTSITSIDRSVANVLTFTGIGMFGGTLGLAGPDIASTAGTFTFSTQGTGTSLRTTFSATAGAVPEPATWALMLLGFGGIGMSVRRRRKPALMQLA